MYVLGLVIVLFIVYAMITGKSIMLFIGLGILVGGLVFGALWMFGRGVREWRRGGQAVDAARDLREQQRAAQQPAAREGIDYTRW